MNESFLEEPIAQIVLYKEFDRELKRKGRTRHRNRPGKITVRISAENAAVFHNSRNTIMKSKFINECIEYINDEIRYTQPTLPLTVEVENKTNDMDITRVMKETIRDYVSGDIEESYHEFRKNSILAAALSLAGLAFLALIAFFTHFFSQFVFREFFVVIAWVLIWRAVELFFFENQSIRMKKYRLMQLYFAEFVTTNTTE